MWKLQQQLIINMCSPLECSLPMRKLADLSLNESLDVRPYTFNPNIQYIAKITLEVDFLEKKMTLKPYDTDEMATKFLRLFAKQAFFTGQTLAFHFKDMKLLKLVVMEMEVVSIIERLSGNGKSTEKRTTRMCLLLPDTVVVFEKAKDSAVNLVGKSKDKIARQSIINLDWDFQKMGIGGLDNEFSATFRRAFASRVFPPEIVQQLGLKLVRGILLYGPPGTGKSLIAHQIGQMLTARKPKIVNGPQLLKNFVGVSEAYIRVLFADAEEEEKRLGPNSGLHIIIFDEIDAICTARNNVLSHLVAKIDGIESLNNIFIIGMTNRKDMIDEALLRPGRLEVQIEIGLPDENGRLQILNIHTSCMRQHNKLGNDVNLKELATLTKNFTGAEIEGLVRAALSTAMNRFIKAANKVEIDLETTEKIKVSKEDFLHALEYDMKPAFGTSTGQVERLVSQGIIIWGPPVPYIMENVQLLIQQARSPDTRGLVSVLLEGPPNSGKTALAAKLALKSEFPFVELCNPEDMVGYTETDKCQMIKKVFDDAYKSHYSCILVDSIERLLDYGAIGPYYSNMVLQTLLILLKKEPPKGRKLLIFCTSSRCQVLEEMEMISAFTSVFRVPNLSSSDHLMTVLKESGCFQREELMKIARITEGHRVWVGIKKLLDYIDVARQTDDEHRVVKFLIKLEDENCLEDMWNLQQQLIINMCSPLEFSMPMRKTADLSLNQTLEVRPYVYNPNIQYIAKIKKWVKLNYLEKKTETARQTKIYLDWEYQRLGLGGLDNEFNAIFRRVFASRVFPPEFVQQLGLKHVRGILLYGPPGTGKTLMARQIGQMLYAREPKIVNGPQILEKYEGDSEANIRKLFAEAEEEENKLGPNSRLHIIIFDKMEAIFKTRRSMAGNNVPDSVVNQLLSEIDGVKSLNNILVIGTTDRKDMIDEALLRLGRLEVHMEIGLPDESGRLQILNIHTSCMRQHNKLGNDVNLKELATLTKNFTGAEIEGLVRAALSTAMNRLIKVSRKIEIDPKAVEKIKVNRADFLHALEFDIKPAFGTSAQQFERLVSQGIINWGPPVTYIMEDVQLLIREARSPDTRGLVTVLLEGPPNSGKTALAAKLALKLEFPFVELCNPEDMVGYTETDKCQMIKKVFDNAYKSHYSCIFVDSIERLLDYGAIGPCYSNMVLQTLLVLLKKEPPKGRKLLIFCTSSRRQVLEEMEMISAFTFVLHVSNLSSSDHLMVVLEESGCFRKEELMKIARKTEGRRVWVGIKKLLAYIDLVRQTDDDHRVDKFLTKLEEENCLL